MISAVFDCMVYLQAVANPRGPAAACFEFVENNHVKVFLSPAILDEIRDVLFRPSIRKRFPRITDESAETFLKKILEIAVWEIRVPPVIQLPRDPDDEPYLHLAIAAGAMFLVSRDKDLLSFDDDEGLRTLAPGLSIITPTDFLAYIRIHIGKENESE